MKRAMLVLTVVMALTTACQQKSQPLVTPVANPAEQPANPALAMPSAIPAPAPTATASTKEQWIALGNDQMDAQRFADAIVSYQKALDIDPGNLDVRVDLGTCYRGIGESDRAIEEYAKALAINPRHPNANRNSGVVLAYDLNKKAEAVKFFEAYLKIWPTAPDASQIFADIQRLKAGK